MVNSKKREFLLYSIPLLLLLIFFVSKAISLGYSDFASYYFGSKLLLNCDYKTAYETASLNLYAASLNYQNLFISYTPFPPFTSVFFAPFTYIPIGNSKLLYNSISCICFLFVLYRSINFFSIKSAFILIVPILFYTPIRSNIFFGQSYLLLFCMLMEGFIAYKKGQIFLSSSLWGLAILFKIFPIVIFLFLLTKREYKNAFYLSATCLVLFLFSILIIGIQPWRFYLFEIFPRLNNGELNNSYTYIFQSAFMLLKNIFIYDEIANPNSIYPNLYLFSFLTVFFKTAILTAAVLLSKKKDISDFMNFSIWIMASIIISPNGSTYSLILLLIPFIAVIKSDFTDKQKFILAAILLLITNLPIHYFSNLPLLLKFPRLYLLISFFAIIITLIKIRFDYKIAFGFIFFFLILESPKLFTKTDNSSYYLPSNKYELIYNYNIENNLLTIDYWSIRGKQKDTWKFNVKNYTLNGLCIKENQIYFNNINVTSSPDWKRKPILVNNEYILYLSDKNRGVGFFTLRKLKI